MFVNFSTFSSTFRQTLFVEAVAIKTKAESYLKYFDCKNQALKCKRVMGGCLKNSSIFLYPCFKYIQNPSGNFWIIYYLYELVQIWLDFTAQKIYALHKNVESGKSKFTSSKKVQFKKMKIFLDTISKNLERNFADHCWCSF